MSKITDELHQIGIDMQEALLRGLSTTGHGNSDLASSIKYKIEKGVVIITMNEYGEYLNAGTCGTEKCGGKSGLYFGSSSPHERFVSRDMINNLKRYSDNPWPIANSINRYGTRAYPFIYKLDDITDKVAKRLLDAGVKDAREILNKFKIR